MFRQSAIFQSIRHSCFLSAWPHYEFQKSRNEEGKAPYTAPYRSPLHPVRAARSSAPFRRQIDEPLRKGDHWPLWEDDGKFCTGFSLFTLDTNILVNWNDKEIQFSNREIQLSIILKAACCSGFCQGFWLDHNLCWKMDSYKKNPFHISTKIFRQDTLKVVGTSPHTK